MIDKILVGPNFPVPYQTVRFSDYEVERGRVGVLRKVQNWKPTASKPGLLLVGAPGLAKTMLACAVLNEHQLRHASGNLHKVSSKFHTNLKQYRYPVYFVSLADWVSTQIQLFSMRRDVESGHYGAEEVVATERLLEDLKHRVKILVIDDVGKEHRTSSEFAEDAFDLLVRTRFNEGLSTVYTSNVPIPEWSRQYSPAMRNFIERTCTVIEFRKPINGTG